MTRQVSVRLLLIVAGLLNSPAHAAVVDVDKRFKPQAEQVLSDPHKGQKHSEISQGERAKVTTALDRIEAALEAPPGVTALQSSQGTALQNDQELITQILTMAGEDGRPTAGARVHLVRRSVPSSV
ncbi:hypothetical protein LL972_00040 [Xanthomonas campestris pv. asclepiadis]|uniref:hypothetical protein n=1 Tax=Xanthomonas campestris TaxID=339 RepID=UPI001E46150D|nr:hypothetical protein [Xanthomonas campestris]MCC4614431.1 hypothetical protein [Xanthomonas campestris pv. asclepiadis]